MSTFKFFEIMERYARGPMNSEERANFESELRKNPALAAEWTDYLLIARSVRNSLRASSSQSSDIQTLVKDARSLAEERGLLLTNEDIWLHIRGQLDADKTKLVDARLQDDASFSARYAKERSIIEGIRKFTDKQKVLDRVRDSLHVEGFTQSINLQIEKDLEEEKNKQRQSGANTNKGPFDFLLGK